MTTRSSSPAAGFETLGVGAPLLRALAAQGFSAPLPIQAATLPDTLAGRDVLARGRTGSGKTLAFSIPMVDRLHRLGHRRLPGRPAGLVLAPTRELATQIAATLEPLTDACGLRVVTVFGGVPQARQVRELRSGADIVVACPGRLEDLIKQGLVALDEVRITVLDEADHMADLGFLPGVTRILAATPADGQRMLFSATLDNGVNKLVQRFLRNPLSHTVDEAHSPVPAMTHHVFEIGDSEAKRALVHTLASGTGRRILFMRTKHHARRLAKQLTIAGIPAADLHGNLSQVARDRNLAAFADGSTRVLVATDIAARGVHVDDVELVVHVDPPAEHKAYLHRSGRTARAGSTGDVVTIMLPEQRKDVAVLLRKAGLDVRPQQVSPDSAQVAALVGPVAAPVTPPAAKAERADQSSRRPARGDSASRRSGRRGPAARGERGESANRGRTATVPTGRTASPRSRTGHDGDRAAAAASETATGGRGTAARNRRTIGNQRPSASDSGRGARTGHGRHGTADAPARTGSTQSARERTAVGTGRTERGSAARSTATPRAAGGTKRAQAHAPSAGSPRPARGNR
ncbi:DEAD/DEAH box helicase [Nocardia africana]|uniref:ATP-dependent RNA helicase rhlE n=1 Tax=Nocardia africana TaxID=134964 RepID=A0A378X2R5_9NOCA|nr:DEAD/DEAH box helicase [Nocardia africana]MCC3311613.1 DEAD/DEAH box helicase [Nocardia africana]SUA47125.1 ATP-dependent RNA helicase rhlE [Nocardia africana]